MQSLMQLPEETKPSNDSNLVIMTPNLTCVTFSYVVEDLIESIRNTVIEYHRENPQLFRSEVFFRIKAASRVSNEWVYHISMSGVPRSATMKHNSATNMLNIELKNRYMLRPDNLVQDPSVAQSIAVALLGHEEAKSTEATAIQQINLKQLHDTVANWVAPKIKDKNLPPPPEVILYTKNRISFASNPSLVLRQKIINVVDNPHNGGAVVVLEKETVEIVDRDKSSVYKQAKALKNYHGTIYLLSNRAGQGLVVSEKGMKLFKSVD